MLPKLTVVSILQLMHTSNHYAVFYAMSCVNYISIKLKKLRFKIKISLGTVWRTD